jgi:predicted phage-related endonuclease
MNGKDRAEWLTERLKYIGGSDANILMSGDDEKIYRLWQVKTGAAEDEDLAWVLPVQMGVATEELNLRWFEHATGSEVSRRGEHVVLRDHPFIACTLDGFLRDLGDVVECKHVNAFTNFDEQRAKYWPQLHHAMAVTGASGAWLSVFLGTLKHEYERIECDNGYLAELLDREMAFWKCVETRTPPPGFSPVGAPAAPAVKEYDFSGDNQWASAAVDWLDNRGAKKTFDGAEKELKALVPDDAARCHGHSIECTRDKAGRLRIKEI